MAKKSKKSSLLNYFPFLLLVIGLVSFVMFFLDALNLNGEALLKGTDAAFGKEVVLGEFKFSLFALLAYVLPLAAAVVAVCPMNKKKNSLKFGLCALLFAVSAFLLFVMPSYVDTYYGSVIGGTYHVDLTLAVGTILGGSFASLGAVVSVSTFFLK